MATSVDKGSDQQRSGGPDQAAGNEQAAKSPPPIDDGGAAPASTDTAPATSLPWYRRFATAYLSRKKWSVPLTILAATGLLLAVPFTRYSVLGLAVKRDYAVAVVDESTKKPVTNATVSLAGQQATTDNKGRVALNVKVGTHRLEVSKKYYQSVSTQTLVALSQKHGAFTVYLKATGRQVPVTVVNKITGKPVENVVVRAEGTETKTGKDGKATIVLPAGRPKVTAEIRRDAYVAQTSTIVVTDQAVKENNFSVTPAGKIFFLSKLSGKIDVVKTNLDGTQRETVVAGSGNEEQWDTVLLASRDWKYLALKSKRDGGKNAKLFLIEAATGRLSTIDEGNGYFSLIGWSDHHFVYQVNRHEVKDWQPRARALKSYHAPSGRLATIDETEGEGTGQYNYARSDFSLVSILDGGELVYGKNWYGTTPCCHFLTQPSNISEREVQLISVKADGTAKKVIKSFDIPTGTGHYTLSPVLYAPGEVYVQVPGFNGAKNAYYEYEHGKIETAADITDEIFRRGYPTYLESPSSKRTFWSESRDGKNVLFVGNHAGEEEKQIASLSEYAQYGWYSDDYLLVSKGRSELYIMPAAGGTPFKVTDYHRAEGFISGYGGY